MTVPVMAISNLVLTQQIYSEETNGAHAHNLDRVPLKKSTKTHSQAYHTDPIKDRSREEVEMLGVTFQCDSKFSVHVKNKLIKANKSLHILRTLRIEGYNQSEIDPLFNAIVLLNTNYALCV